MKPQNEFQALMRRWTALGPYNALHVLRVAGRADAESWERAAAAPLADIGLQPQRIATIYEGIETGVTAELNKAFSPGDAPLRFFLVEDSGDSHCIGITFDHWIADSQSIRFLMQRVFENHETPGAAPALPPLKLCGRSFHELFGTTSWPAAIAECLQKYVRHRRAYRLHIRDPLDFSSGFQHRQMSDGLIDRIRRFAQKAGTSVNDVFLAAAAQALGTHIAADVAKKRPRLFQSRRDHLALSVAVDIRPLARESLDDVFGFFLSYYTVLAVKPEGMPLDRLASQIAAQTKPVKSKRHTLRFFRGFKFSNTYWDRCVEPRRRALMFHKVVPMLGGISNVNLTDSWIGRTGRVLDYIRISPTGPLLPMVFTLTTIRDRLSLCTTHRSTVFSNATAAAIAADFAARLEAL